MSDWRAFWQRIADPFALDRAPAENPNRVSAGNRVFHNQYSPPTYGDDIAAARAPRLSVGQVAITDPQPIEPDGMGGPEQTGPSRDIIPNAPHVSEAEIEAQAMRDAMAAARASMRTEPVPYNENARWLAERDAIERLRQRDREAQAELARREGVSFEDWWRFGGRQSEDWTPDQPAYRLSRLPQQERQAQNGRRLGARR